MTYPIIEQRQLTQAARSGLFRMGRYRRDLRHLPAPKAHQVLVYKYGSDYIVESGLDNLDADHVTQVTNVSVVDMRVDQPVTVQAVIPAAAAGQFTVQVTFLCTVRDPVHVVRAGITDMTEPLVHYLTSHQELFELSETNEFDEVNFVRKSVTAEIKAYMALRPPPFNGIHVELGNIQVLTPAELEEFERARRAKRQEARRVSEEAKIENQLALEKQELEHELASASTELADLRLQVQEAQELARLRHEEELDQARQHREHQQHNFEQGEELQRDEHERTLSDRRRTHALQQMIKLGTELGAGQEDLAMILGIVNGEMKVGELVARGDRERDRDREESAEERAWRRENKRRKKEWKQEDKRADRAAVRDDNRYKLQTRLQMLQYALGTLESAVQKGLADDRTFEDVRVAVSGVLGVLADTPPDSLESAESADSPDSARSRSDGARKPGVPADEAHDAAAEAEDVEEAEEVVVDENDDDDTSYVVGEEHIGG
jgi:hypothetical protein